MKRRIMIGTAAALALLAVLAATDALGRHGARGQRWQLAQMSSHDLCYALGYGVKPDGQC